MALQAADPLPGPTAHAGPRLDAPPFGRWGQLVLGVVCMVMIANPQYGRTFFVPDIQNTLGFDRGAILSAFPLLVPFESCLAPAAHDFQQNSGNRDCGFLVAAGADILASLLAISVLKPWRVRAIARSA